MAQAVQLCAICKTVGSIPALHKYTKSSNNPLGALVATRDGPGLASFPPNLGAFSMRTNEKFRSVYGFVADSCH